ncbi:MAG: spore maturation protein [Lachnospiraceae bacterium]|nr:spore maturation protein [Lachnospiraceae bacterium]
MNMAAQLSALLIPAVIFYIVGYGLIGGNPVYNQFLEGAGEGLSSLAKVLPTLLGLLVAVGVLRSSGLLDFIAELLSGLEGWTGIGKELYPVILAKLFSNSAATGLVLDIFKKYGADSLSGRTAAVMMCSTESAFYTMSVYFLAVKVTKTRYTLPGALVATFAGLAASVFLATAM